MLYGDATSANTLTNVVVTKDFDPTMDILEKMTKQLQLMYTELAMLKTGKTKKAQS